MAALLLPLAQADPVEYHVATPDALRPVSPPPRLGEVAEVGLPHVLEVERLPPPPYPWVEWRDTDCGAPEVHVGDGGVGTRTDVDRCTPIVHPDPLPDEACEPAHQECCKGGIGTHCTRAAPILERYEVGSEWPTAFCAGVGIDGADVDPDLRWGSSCSSRPTTGRLLPAQAAHALVPADDLLP